MRFGADEYKNVPIDWLGLTPMLAGARVAAPSSADAPLRPSAGHSRDQSRAHTLDLCRNGTRAPAPGKGRSCRPLSVSTSAMISFSLGHRLRVPRANLALLDALPPRFDITP